MLDTNVIVAGLRSRRGASHRLLELVDEGVLQPVLSVPLVLEYEQVLRRGAAELRLSNQEVEAFIDALCGVGEKREIYFLWRPILRDPRDELVLELAVTSNVPYLVTHNVRDFAGAESLGVRVVTPRQVLEETGVGR